MDYQKLYTHMAIEHGLFLLDSQMEEIVDIVLEMHNENPEKCTETIKEPSNNDQMKTAVEYLAERYDYIIWMRIRDEISEVTAVEWREKFLEKAKKLEKEQIVNAYKEGCSDSILDESTDKLRAEDYYNETYNPDQV